MYTIQILRAASRELEALDKMIGRRIVQRVRWIAENFDLTKPMPLKGELLGFYKLREGDYRII